MNIKKVTGINKEDWDRINSEIGRVEYPSEYVGGFLASVKKDSEERAKVLDAGCGTGRHLVMTAKAGKIPYGIDYSESGVNASKDLLYKNGLQFLNNIELGDIQELPFDDAEFNGIICYDVLHYMEAEQIKKAIGEMYRVLKIGGRLMLRIRTVDDFRYRAQATGVNGDKSGLVLHEVDESKESFKENGMFIHFFTRNEVEELIKEFVCVEINSEKIYHNNDSYVESNYIVTAEKPLLKLKHSKAKVRVCRE